MHPPWSLSPSILLHLLSFLRLSSQHHTSTFRSYRLTTLKKKEMQRDQTHPHFAAVSHGPLWRNTPLLFPCCCCYQYRDYRQGARLIWQWQIVANEASWLNHRATAARTACTRKFWSKRLKNVSVSRLFGSDWRQECGLHLLQVLLLCHFLSSALRRLQLCCVHGASRAWTSKCLKKIV